MKELCFHALSPKRIDEYDDQIMMIDVSMYLHKLIEATHLIAVRIFEDEIKSRKKWKGEG